MLTLYRQALRIRRSLPGLHATGLEWRDSAEDVLVFDRGAVLRCVVNFSGQPQPLPAGEVLLASLPLADGAVPPDGAAWLRP
jgi:alpha-glucosidase